MGDGNLPFTLDNLPKSIRHGIVPFGTGKVGFGLKLHPRFDDIERIKTEELGDSCDGTGCELGIEWQGLGLVRWSGHLVIKQSTSLKARECTVPKEEGGKLIGKKKGKTPLKAQQKASLKDR